MAKKASWGTLIPIRDMSRAVRFYTKTMGAKLTYRAPGAMRNFFASLDYAGTTVWLVAPQKVEKRALAYNVLLVPNIRRFVADLQRKGVKFQRAERMGPETKVEGPISFDPFGAAAFFKDPEGNLLMAWQESSDSA